MKTGKNAENVGGDFRDRAAEHIAGGILHMQQKTASMLNRKVSGLPSCILKSYLLLFCLLFGLACFWIILTSVWFPANSLVKPVGSVNENIGKPSGKYPDTIRIPSVNSKNKYHE